MSAERLIAGLWCHEVADRLEAYVGGRLSDDDKGTLETHVNACVHCASFGARYARLIDRVRGVTADPSEDVAVARVLTNLKP
jgi:anti-sigma factor RsiW